MTFFLLFHNLTKNQIPLLDHLCEILMPETPLTKILHEFRAYRPLPHREFLTYIREKSVDIGVQKYSVQDSETAVLFLKVLNHVRSFRWRHWLFAREYIIRRTPHPTATGGSPIVTVSVFPLYLLNFKFAVYLVGIPQIIVYVIYQRNHYFDFVH